MRDGFEVVATAIINTRAVNAVTRLTPADADDADEWMKHHTCGSYLDNLRLDQYMIASPVAIGISRKRNDHPIKVSFTEKIY